jgi:hypothetical protein
MMRTKETAEIVWMILQNELGANWNGKEGFIRCFMKNELGAYEFTGRQGKRLRFWFRGPKMAIEDVEDLYLTTVNLRLEQISRSIDHPITHPPDIALDVLHYLMKQVNSVEIKVHCTDCTMDREIDGVQLFSAVGPAAPILVALEEIGRFLMERAKHGQ